LKRRLHANDRMRIWPRILTFCLALGAPRPLPARSPAEPPPPAIHNRAMGFSREFVSREIARQQKGASEALGEWIAGYDLTATTRRMWDGLAGDDAFQRFVETRCNSSFREVPHPRQAELAREYFQANTNFPSEATAWYSLISDTRAPWGESMQSYQRLGNNRGKDVAPRMVVLFRPLRTGADAEQFLPFLDETYDSAGERRERALCLLCVPAHAVELSGMAGGDKTLAGLADWLDELKSAEKTNSPAAGELGFIQFFVAFARKDFARAADLAENARLRSIRPLMFLLAGRTADAQKALAELRESEMLSPEEQDAVDTVREILSGLAAGEAGAAVWRQPGAPKSLNTGE